MQNDKVGSIMVLLMHNELLGWNERVHETQRKSRVLFLLLGCGTAHGKVPILDVSPYTASSLCLANGFLHPTYISALGTVTNCSFSTCPSFLPLESIDFIWSCICAVLIQYKPFNRRSILCNFDEYIGTSEGVDECYSCWRIYDWVLVW